MESDSYYLGSRVITHPKCSFPFNSVYPIKCGSYMTKQGGITWQERVCGKGSAGQTTDAETDSRKLKQKTDTLGG